jgi:hypothetical protein
MEGRGVASILALRRTPNTPEALIRMDYGRSEIGVNPTAGLAFTLSVLHRNC